MSIPNVTIAEVHRKNYDVYSKKGKKVDKKRADSTVKRNMVAAKSVIPAGLVFATTSAFNHSKDAMKENAVFGILSGIIGFMFGQISFKEHEERKDYDPKSFYKWGGYTVKSASK